MKHNRFSQRLSLCLLGILLISGCTTAAETPALQTAENQGCGETETACESPAVAEEAEDMTEISFDQAIQYLESMAPGVYYFGFEKCPWCQEAVPVLLEEAEKTGQQIFYVKTRDEDKKRLYDDAQKERITPFLEPWMKDNEDGELTLYVPLGIRVHNGEITGGPQGTVEGHDAKEAAMTDQQKQALAGIYHKVLTGKTDTAG
ncbi:hypothetical protein [uncultured Faecalibaculum sp.]|uniref:hypothetical protein n=1 Tax=uncultured Faecalibaculum sp. TaxID=1729681 RepID=UPI00272A704B|nr:hypothetical protein [uncultured Faecalibaculum sp.]